MTARTRIGGGRATPLLERDREVAALTTSVRDLVGGAGGCVVVEAAAGLGKSALLRTAEVMAARAGRRVLTAAGAELAQRTAFGVAARLLGPTVERADAADRARLLAGSARLAAPLLGVGGSTGGPGGPEAEPVTQQALVHALHWIAINLAGDAGMTLIVDDLHWVDEPSVRLLAYLARRARDLPILIVTALRPDTPAHETEAVQQLLRARTLTLTPAPLSARAASAALTAWAEEPPAAALAAAAVAAAQGNPLLLSAFAGTLAGEVDAAEIPAAAEIMARAVTAMLTGLPAEAVALAEALAVLDPFSSELAPALAGLTPADAPVAVLREAGLVGAEPDTAQLAHPLVRAALRNGLSPRAREALHRRAADLHAARGEMSAAAAHLTETASRGEPGAALIFVAAAEEAIARASPAAAAVLVQRALAEPPAPDRVPFLLALLARCQSAAGDSRAAATYARAIAAHPGPADRAELLLELAWTHQSRGNFAEAVEASARGLELGEIAPDVRIELATLHDAAVIWSPSDSPERARAVERLGVSGTEGRAGRVMMADAARRQMFVAADDYVTISDLARRAWDGGRLLAESTSDDPSLIRVLTVFHNADALPEALEVAERCLTDAQRRASPLARATWIHLRGHVLLYMGRLPEAEADLREAFAAREDGWGAWLPVTAGALVDTLLEQDELEAAAGVLADAERSTTHPPESPMWSNLRSARSRYRLRTGDAEGALEEALFAGRWAAAALGTSNPALDPWRCTAVEALAVLGRGAEARELAAAELDGARTWNAPRALARALRMNALVAEPEAHGPLLREAAAVLQDSPARLESAAVLLALGEHEHAARDAAARETLRTALDMAAECGAAALAGRAQAALVAAGGRPRRRRTSGVDALTVSERRVAEHAALGLSARETAEALFVTPKTVAYHLGNVYRKLGISGRRELAAALAGGAAPAPAPAAR